MFPTAAEIPRRRLTAVLLLAAVLALTACSGTSTRKPSVDARSVELAIEQIDGVTDAEVGMLNAGTPGNYILNSLITIDEAGDAGLAAVIRDTAVVLSREAPEVGRYTVSVIAPVPGEPGETDVVTLSERKAEVGLPGNFTDTDIEWTGEQLRAAAGSGQ
jgi:hypothetical protein